MPIGLNDFLKHIKSNSQNDTLIDRFMTLVSEVESQSRQPYLEKLFKILHENNPHGALRAAYFNLQIARSEGAGTLGIIDALQRVEQAFVRLGRTEHAELVKSEIVKLSKVQSPPIGERRKRKADLPAIPVSGGEEAVAEQRFTHNRAEFINSLYESAAQQFLAALELSLNNFSGPLKTDLIAAHLLQSFRAIYLDLNSTLRNSIAVFGKNPMLVTEDDQFRDELIQVFLRSPLFIKSKDRIAAQRIRLVTSLLVAWFDQQLRCPTILADVDQLRLHSKLLEVAIGGVLLFDD